jgi:hypothetical protein
MVRLSLDDTRCEALFASGLQRSDPATPDAVMGAISDTVRLLGSDGCVGRMAQEFGDHPEEARDRMLWARQLVSELPPSAPQTTGGARPAA